MMASTTLCGESMKREALIEKIIFGIVEFDVYVYNVNINKFVVAYVYR